MTQNLVIVESPAKARTIGSYLGRDYRVVASFGHVRDLPSRDGSVIPEKQFEMRWQLASGAKKRIDEMADLCLQAQKLYLATDPDREGEAISWHILKELEKRKATRVLTNVHRVVFHEITKTAVQKAIETPRDIDQALIDAYMARRSLDYLVGFTLSPVLWRKLPGARSAGRVQSVALRLVCAKEDEIEAFKSREYWSVTAKLSDGKSPSFEASLSELDGKKLTRYELDNSQKSEVARQCVLKANLTLESTQTKQTKRHPTAPFITSSLQQEASRKLGFDTKFTMSVAQKLYEGINIGGETVGLITYMRTDSPQLSGQAIHQLRDQIQKQYGPKYLPASPRQYKAKNSNAQEAHEAIRPTSVSRTPEKLSKVLNAEQLKLYDLIWKRAMASQMASADIERVEWLIKAQDQSCALSLSGSTILFDGFMALYLEGRDEKENNKEQPHLPHLVTGAPLYIDQVDSEQHFTQPPARYSEASLVKKLEELSIGRPSTYAAILSVLRMRGYVDFDKKRFKPNMRGRLVTAFLTHFFSQWIDFGFTAQMEQKLDEIARGQLEWLRLMEEFWKPFKQRSEELMELKRDEICKVLDEALSLALFGADGDLEQARLCPQCSQGKLSLNYGKWGAYTSCSRYPECKYTLNIDRQIDQPGESDVQGQAFPKSLGQDPKTGLEVSVRKGPYGYYLQLGDKTDNNQPDNKPKRVSLDKKYNPADIDFEFAYKMLSLPREIGTHPESGEKIEAGIGRYGPYLRHQRQFINLSETEEVFSIGINRAGQLIADKGKTAKIAGKEIGVHPDLGGAIIVKSGRYGPYVTHQKVNASLPKDMSPDELTIDQAVELLNAKKSSGKRPKTTNRKKSSKS
ncbi:MAG: type I DNA topoisomerase [Pseudomonadota bacterium]